MFSYSCAVADLDVLIPQLLENLVVWYSTWTGKPSLFWVSDFLRVLPHHIMDGSSDFHIWADPWITRRYFLVRWWWWWSFPYTCACCVRWQHLLLSSFLLPRNPFSPVLSHCNFKVLFVHICVSFADHSNTVWWMFPSRFTGIYEKFLRSPFRS